MGSAVMLGVFKGGKVRLNTSFLSADDASGDRTLVLGMWWCPKLGQASREDSWHGQEKDPSYAAETPLIPGVLPI